MKMDSCNLENLLKVLLFSRNHNLTVVCSMFWVSYNSQCSVFRLSLFYCVVPVKNHLPVNLPVNRPSGKFQRFTTLLVTVISLKYEIRVASHGPDHDDCHRDGEEIDVEPAERDPIERKKKIAVVCMQKVEEDDSSNQNVPSWRRRRAGTGWPIWWRTWVGLTLIWDVPPSCLGSR